ncbi:MAG: hypothetical protein JNK82_03515, partial [Myxococcaceae bacterium]|nr:hypothetical protein [Myxococcaceae bacterium]
MVAQLDDALDKAVRIARELEAAKLPYAIGGALAYGRYGIPRATHDVDVNAFVDASRLGEVIAALERSGVVLDAARAERHSADEGMFIGHLDGMRIDVFMPSIDFSWEAMRTRVRLPVGDEQFWFLSAEALSVFKLLFFRGKDIVDLERLVAVYGAKMDLAYVRRQI